MWILDDDEIVLWQGRPAPRCYLWRHWLQILLGTVLFMASSFWLMTGYQLYRAGQLPLALLLLPALLSLIAFAVGPGMAIVVRLRWEKVFYALTNKHLLVRQRLFGNRIERYPRTDILRYRTKLYAAQLQSVQLIIRQRRPLVLACLEHAEPLLQQLPSDKH